MTWDVFSPVYDLTESIYNGRVYTETGKIVAGEIESGDTVLECACGTGAISVYVAPHCKKLYATDVSAGMRKKCAAKCRKFDNVIVTKADIMHINSRDERFDKVIAGNVIHLLDDPKAAVKELLRVCRTGGEVIIPTYINLDEGNSNKFAVKVFETAGVEFKRKFDLESYKKFFEDMGFEKVRYEIAWGRIPCAVAIITKEQK